MKVEEKSKTLQAIGCQCESARCFHGDETCWHFTHTYYSVDNFAVLALCIDCVVHYEGSLSPLAKKRGNA